MTNDPRPDDELSALSDEERLILEQMAELQKKQNELLAKKRELIRADQERRAEEIRIEQEKKAEEARKAEEERLRLEALKPVQILFSNLNVYLQPAQFVVRVMTRNTPRPDINETLRAFGPRYDMGRNWFSVNKWGEIHEALSKLENIEIVYEGGVDDHVRVFLKTPRIFVERIQRTFRVAYRLDYPRPPYFPGAAWTEKRQDERYVTHVQTVPFSEGWRIFKAFESNMGDVVVTEEANAMIEDQIQKRVKADRIAKMKDVMLKVPFANGHKPRNFQKVAMYFAEEMAKNDRIPNALIADPTGSGKTWDAIGCAERQGLRTLFICKASLKPNIRREIVELTGKQPITLSGMMPSKYDLQMIRNSNAQYWIANYDIMAGHIKIMDEKDEEVKDRVFMWIKVINEILKPDLIVMDECHYIKNMSALRTQACRQLEAKGFLGLSATPITNRPGEYFPMLHLIDPDRFPSHDTFVKQYTEDGKQPKNAEELLDALKTIMIRRSRKDIMPDLPDLERVLRRTEITERGRQLYALALKRVWEALAEYDAKGRYRGRMGINGILPLITRLKQIVSLESTEYTADLVTELVDSMSDLESNNKVIVFTQFKASAVNLAQRLGDLGCLSFVTRESKDFKTADIEDRFKLVDQFNNDPNIKVIIVTAETAAEGLNMTQAGCVVFNDLFWTPAKHEQCEGRAYGRLSNLHGLTAYYVLMERSGDEDSDFVNITEWIWELLQLKQEIINATVEGVQAARDESIGEALLNKFREWKRG